MWSSFSQIPNRHAPTHHSKRNRNEPNCHASVGFMRCLESAVRLGQLDLNFCGVCVELRDGGPCLEPRPRNGGKAAGEGNVGGDGENTEDAVDGAPQWRAFFAHALRLKKDNVNVKGTLPGINLVF